MSYSWTVLLEQVAESQRSTLTHSQRIEMIQPECWLVISQTTNDKRVYGPFFKQRYRKVRTTR